VIRKPASGEYRLYSRKVSPQTGKRRNLGTFRTRAAAEKHEREVQHFKRRCRAMKIRQSENLENDPMHSSGSLKSQRNCEPRVLRNQL